MRYGVIILTYNRLELLKECIQKVNDQILAPEKIIIVNNCSTDGTDAYLKHISDPRYIIVDMPENKGASGGFAEGIKKSQSLELDYILIIDDDAFIANDYLKAMDDFLLEHQEIEAISGTVYSNGAISFSHRRRVTNRKWFILEPVPLNDYSMPYFEYDISSFCGLVVSSKMVSKIGLPRTDFFTQYTDTEYSLRIRQHTKIVNVNNTHLDHIIEKSASSKIISASYKMYYGERNRIVTILLYTKHIFKPIQIIRFVLSFFGKLLLGIFRCIIDSQNARLYWLRIRMYYDGLVDALKGRLGINPKYKPNY